MLTLVPKSWFSWDFRVIADGADIALIDRHSFRERASFTLDGKEYVIRRTSMVRGTFVLEHSGQVLAEASKPSSFRRLFELSVGSASYTLKAVSSLRREFGLFSGSASIARIRPVSAFGRKAIAEFRAGIPREVQLFAVFLVLILWKRVADAAAAT